MAVLKVRNSNGKASLGGAKDYLERDGRNVECSTFNIDRPDEWAEDMQLTKELYDKTEGRQYYWIVQSFDNSRLLAFEIRNFLPVSELTELIIK